MAVNNNNKPTKLQATVHVLDFDDVFKAAFDKWLAGESKIFSSSEIIQHVASQIKNIERGDIVDVPHSLDGEPAIRWIWNGQQYIAFTTDIPEDTDYDGVPEEFKVISEFPIHYWSKTNLGGTCYGCDDIHFDYTPYIEEMCENVTIRLTKGNKGSTISTFFHADETLYLVQFDRGCAGILGVEALTVDQVSQDLRSILVGSSKWKITFSAKPCHGYSDAELEKMISANTLFAHFHC